MNDIDDHLAYLRYERGKAAQTLATYRRLLYQFAEAHRDRDLHALEPRDLQNYLTKTLGGGKYSPATLNQHRAALRSYYRWLHRLRGLPTDPAAALKLPRQARQPLPDALTPE
ncbi:MAG: tyrosine-type recombinase/integrase, partial [Cardiobacterium hominis]